MVLNSPKDSQTATGSRTSHHRNDEPAEDSFFTAATSPGTSFLSSSSKHDPPGEYWLPKDVYPSWYSSKPNPSPGVPSLVETTCSSLVSNNDIPSNASSIVPQPEPAAPPPVPSPSAQVKPRGRETVPSPSSPLKPRGRAISSPPVQAKSRGRAVSSPPVQAKPMSKVVASQPVQVQPMSKVEPSPSNQIRPTNRAVLSPSGRGPPMGKAIIPSPSVQVEQMGGAIVHHNVAGLRKMLASGYDPNSCMRGGTSALRIAARWGYVDMAMVLLEYGAKVNLVNANGETPLMIAAQYQHVGMVNHLLRIAKADPSIRTKSGANAVNYAMMRPESALVSAMIVETLLNAEQKRKQSEGKRRIANRWI